MHEFAYIWTPVIALNSMCVQASVCLCKSMRVCVCVCLQANIPTDVMETDGSGALHTLCLSTAHAGALRRSPHVCSVVGAFLPACVCRGSVLLSAATGIGAAATDGTRVKSASRQRACTHVGTPQTTHERRGGTLSFMASYIFF